jgi:hypothetical protein
MRLQVRDSFKTLGRIGLDAVEVKACMPTQHMKTGGSHRVRARRQPSDRPTPGA